MYASVDNQIHEYQYINNIYVKMRDKPIMGGGNTAAILHSIYIWSVNMADSDY